MSDDSQSQPLKVVGPRPEIPPLQPLEYRSPNQSFEGAVFRMGSTLHAYDRAILPERCIKCGSTEGVEMKTKKFTWCPSWVYILLVVSLLIGAIVAMAVQKKASITFGLCAEHRARRFRNIMITLGIVVVALAFIGVAIMFDQPVYLLGTLGGLLLSAIYGLITIPTLRPSHIDRTGMAQYRGCGEDFLQGLPSSSSGTFSPPLQPF